MQLVKRDTVCSGLRVSTDIIMHHHIMHCTSINKSLIRINHHLPIPCARYDSRKGFYCVVESNRKKKCLGTYVDSN